MHAIAQPGGGRSTSCALSRAPRSVAALVWEKWLGPRAELVGLRKRQLARAAGTVFDEETNIDDL